MVPKNQGRTSCKHDASTKFGNEWKLRFSVGQKAIIAMPSGRKISDWDSGMGEKLKNFCRSAKDNGFTIIDLMSSMGQTPENTFYKYCPKEGLEGSSGKPNSVR
jgi:hypothetical protein